MAPFSYTAPVEGYYLLNAQVDQTNLVSPDVILGAPTAHLQMYVNGISVRDVVAPYLTFSDSQKSNVSSIVKLNAGDVVTLQYTIDVLSNAGFAPVVGTVDLTGGVNATLLVIQYLSSTCSVPGVVPCEPRECLPCETSGCTPVLCGIPC